MTDEYISREAALEDFESCNAENPNWTPQRVKTLLLRQPAADVAEVVRCRACKYLVDATINANGFLICGISDMEIAPDDFCSYGEYQTNTGGNENVSG